MKQTIFKLFENNDIYFCKQPNNIETNSIDVMLDCFEVFHFDSGWLFYKLWENCDEMGYLDEEEKLIGPSEEGSNMISLVQILKGSKLVQIVDSTRWIEEDEFYRRKRNKELSDMISEIINTDYSIEKQLELSKDLSKKLSNLIDGILESNDNTCKLIDDSLNKQISDIEKYFTDEEIVSSDSSESKDESKKENFMHGFSED